MKVNTLKRGFLGLAALLTLGSTAVGQEQPYAFKVLYQRSLGVTSQRPWPLLPGKWPTNAARSSPGTGRAKRRACAGCLLHSGCRKSPPRAGCSERTPNS